MPIRKTFLATGEIYHVLNRSIHGVPIFKGKRECDLFLESMRFYLQPEPPTRFSIYRTNKDRFPVDLEKKLVTIINYCLIPNHFHLTLRQEEDSGIRKFIQRVSNSFSHYFNRKYKSKGTIFEGNFKAVHIDSNEQLIHLSRYIHLNPVTAYLVEKPQDYFYSSYNIYSGLEKSDIIDSSLILNNFSSFKEYENFVMEQKNYQRSLDKIKYLVLEEE